MLRHISLSVAKVELCGSSFSVICVFQRVCVDVLSTSMWSASVVLPCARETLGRAFIHDVVFVFSVRHCVAAYGGEERFGSLSVNCNWAQRHSFLFPSPFLMTEWMCKYTPTWISRGGSLHKAYMEDEKLLLERYVEVTLCLRLRLPQRTKWLPNTFNTLPRASHTVMCVTVQSHRRRYY